ncbi:MAG: AbrB/MazE/SpoVT family DNA-binding domain-containing protein [Sphingomonadaceae bacterium]
MEVTVSPSGRMSIPAAIRKRLGLERGGKLMLEQRDFGLVLTTLDQRVGHAQELYRKYSEGRKSTSVDEFIAQKRCDATMERY